MFCSKCGARISVHDQACLKCGAQNANYNPPKKHISWFPRKDASAGGTKRKKLSKKQLCIAASVVSVILIMAVIAVCCSISASYRESGVAYSPNGLYAYIANDGSAHFISSDRGVRTFEGKISFGQTTPDQSRYIILYKNSHLVAYKDASETEISSDARQVRAVSNSGCFYMTGKHQHLWYYDFASGESVDVGLEDMTLYFSNGSTSLVAIDENLEMSMFSCTDKKVRPLCNFGENDNNQICCIADDGSNVVWSQKSENEFLIYTMKNGAPERIGRLRNSGKYSFVHGRYFDDSRSFIVYSSGSGQLLLSNRGKLIEVTLPGILGNGNIVAFNGLPIDSNDDKTGMFFLFVKKNKDAATGAIYRMTIDGELLLEADNVHLNDSALDGNDRPIIAGDYLYFLNKDHDFFRKHLEGESLELITTDADAFSISPNGTYAYIYKSEALYYWKTADKSMQLNLIVSKFADNNTFHLSNKDDIVFYIQDRERIEGSYRYKGNAYQAVIGESPRFLKENAINFVHTDSRYVNSESPFISIYESINDDGEILKSFWLRSGGEFKNIVMNVF